MKKIILVLILIITCIKVNAYENKYFNISIPDNYKLTENEEYIYKWEKDKKYISITINSNLDLKYNIETFDEEELNKQKEYLENGINEGLKKYNLKAEVSNINKLSKENTYYLEYDIYYPSKELTGYDMYQKGRMYTTKNYITTIIYSSEEKIDEDKNCKEVFDSFKILDTNLIIKNNLKKYIYIILIVGSILGVIGGIVSYKKRK